MTKIRTYSEMLQYKTLEERFRYLSLKGSVGETTFGFDRHINQKFYTSVQWRQVRNDIIARDEACDLAVPDHEIYGKIIIHHMNPMKVADIESGVADVLNPEFLVCTILSTHNAIHYGDVKLLASPIIERRPGDTTLW